MSENNFKTCVTNCSGVVDKTGGLLKFPIWCEPLRYKNENDYEKCVYEFYKEKDECLKCLRKINRVSGS